MTKSVDLLEKELLHVFRYACRRDRMDIAEFILAALEKLDDERKLSSHGNRPLNDAYRDLIGTCIAGRP
ncbi:hypothetical protein B0E33_30430 (plasmid) [Roseibium algicola]|jgi:hypothetical protein|uniref:Sporulation histidine kinase inhibitor Sda n=1 Tax=Roseibium algicola TaxID=2857014 RepID=A0ABM6IC86_9HYPH|nr:hypothetical protein B0E33_30430 [Roseibium aggregatum]